tara:strand:+ start:236 stop:415 length:180 start_codon:yes stop_codon:yes gene_type:complete
MFLLRLLLVAFIVSYVIWFFNTRIMGKNLSLYKVISWVLLATVAIYIFLAGISALFEGF